MNMWDKSMMWLERESAKRLIARSGVFDATWYLLRYPDVRESDCDPLDHYVAFGAREARQPSPLFDPAYYQTQYPDLDPHRVNPLCHYLIVGEADGAMPNLFFEPFRVRNRVKGSKAACSILGAYRLECAPPFPPGSSFDVEAYYRDHPHVRRLGLNPLENFLTDVPVDSLFCGQPRAENEVLLTMKETRGLEYVGRRGAQTLWTSTIPDPCFHFQRLDAERIDPAHYELSLRLQGDQSFLKAASLRSPSTDGFFEEWKLPLKFCAEANGGWVARFAMTKPARSLQLELSFAEGGNPDFGIANVILRRMGRAEYYQHLVWTALRGGEGSEEAAASLRATFNRRYRPEHVEARQARGAIRTRTLPADGLTGVPAGNVPVDAHGSSLEIATGPLVYSDNVAYFVDRVGEITAADDVVLYVCYSPDGRLSAMQKECIASYSEADYKVIVIINAGEYDPFTDPGPSCAEGLIVRQNVGWDFGAWRHACELIGGLELAQSVSLTNDSVFPVNGAGSLITLRRQAGAASADIVFCTPNEEVTPHLQSYFISFRRSALESGALKCIVSIPYFANKDDLINNVELRLASDLKEAGFVCVPLFELASAKESKKNPTIHHWPELLGAGFPFFKIQLLTSGFVSPDAPEFQAALGARARDLIVNHIQGRVQSTLRSPADASFEPVNSFGIAGGYNEHGAQNAFNPARRLSRPLMVPFAGIEASVLPRQSILGIIHCFYIDVAEDILGELAALKIPMRLILTTDSSKKASALTGLLSRYGLLGSVRVTPNRGRDVAPFIESLAEDDGDEEVVFHLHTKKSKHDDRYANWGTFLRRNLIGDRDIVLSILALLYQPNIGVVFSEHFDEVRGLRNWGYDFVAAQALLSRIGCRINANTLLDFPTGTMFWARRAALQPILDLNLRYEDFEPEAGQIDGTLAHSIERSLLYVCEHAGFRFAKVIAADAPAEYLQDAIFMNAADIPRIARKLTAKLLGNEAAGASFERHVGEIYPIRFASSESGRSRLNLIIPTMKPEKIYGGISTAVATFKQLLDCLPAEVDIRVIVVSDEVDRASIAELSARLSRSCIHVSPSSDAENGVVIVDLASNRHEPLSLRKADVFFATAWWTADLAYRLFDAQKLYFAKAEPVIYLIQDFEPGFYSWSNHYALAEATYWRGGDTIALINSEELFGFMQRRYTFAEAMCVPYEINSRLGQLIRPAEKERIILCYGRPGTARNCFHIIVEALRLWQAAQPALAESFRIVFAGEAFDPGLLGDIRNAEVAGKLSLEDYADLLSRSAIGISLMVSPHPSYPPLEMATAGCWTITNGYEGKDLTRRSSNVKSLNQLNPRALANVIEEVASEVVVGRLGQPEGIKALTIEGKLLNMNDVVVKLWRN